MTVIDFYTHVKTPVSVALRLVPKAYEQYHHVRVLTANEAMTDEMDKRLWTDIPTGFFPHCRLSHPHADQTPIVVDAALSHDGKTAVLINLRDDVPEFFSRFERLLEIVGDDEASLAKGRERYAFYKERGYTLRVHRS
ncbi:MAG: DNA polymerase III subunit chi [Burkholderiales bacterium]|jgi:DNA polymerase-3 subunit chi|nr:DNA polymerase III subunit chi [Burkholderiales bacterium]